MTVTKVLALLTQSRRMNVAWVVLATLFCAFSVFYPLTDTDIWWHLAAGREMASTHHILHQDPFAFSTDHARWIDVHWLFQLFTYGVHSLGGPLLLILAKCILFGATCFLLLIAIPGRRIYVVGAVVCSLLMFSARYLVDVRPIVLTLLYMSAFIFLLERFCHGGKRRFLVLLLPIQVLWTNSQGLFAVGWGIVLMYATGTALEIALARKRGHREREGRIPQRTDLMMLLIALAGVVAVSLVNPFGLDALTFPAKLLERITPATANIFSGNISENAPLFSLWGSPLGRGYVTSTIFALLLGVVSFALNGSKMRFVHLMLFAAFFVLAVMAQRNIVLFLLACVPIIAWNLSNADYARVAEKMNIQDRRPVMLFLLAISLAMLLGNTFKHLRDGVLATPAGSYVSPFCVPAESVSYLREHPVEGTVFNSIRNGGYLLWELFPPKQVYIDSRLMIRKEAFFRDYLALLDDPREFETTRVKYGITHALLPTAPFRRDLGMVKHLYYDPRWRLVYADGFQTVFVLDSLAQTPAVDFDNSEQVDSIAASLETRWKKSPYVRKAAVRYLMHLCTWLGAQESAQALSQRLMPPGKTSRFVR